MRHFATSRGARLAALLFLLIPMAFLSSRRPSASGTVLAANSTFQASDPRFGMNGILPDYYSHVHGIRSFPWASTAVEEGARLNRFSFDWQSVEPQPGVFNWSVPAAYINSDQAHGLTTIATLEHTPYWATTAVTDNPSAQVPSGLNLPWNDTNNTWGAFVAAAASHFRGQVAYWEIWNEPDLQNGSSWKGSRASFFQLLKVAYQAIKAADPSAQVLVGSLNYNPSWLNDVFAADDADPDSVANHGYFDGIGLHSYGRSIGIYTMARQAEQVLTHYGMTNKLIVATELGVAVDDDPFVPATGLVATSAEASSYIIESFAAALAAGVDRILLYRASDVGEPGYYGLLKYSGAARSTAVAYSLALQYFSNVQSARLIQSNPITRVELDEGTQQVTVLWNNAPRPATISLYEKSANGGTLLDATGAPTQAIPDANGYYSITVPAATNNHGANSSDFIIGGGPYILVERGPFVPTLTETPTSTVSSTPTATPTSTSFVPTATITPTATSTATASSTPTATATSIPTFAANAPRVYFTGGQTAGASRETLNITNSLTTTTRLRFTVLGPSGPISTTNTLAPPHAFTDIDPGSWNLPNRANGLIMQSDQPVASSRVLFYGSGASVIAGTASPSTHWYFPGLAASSPITQTVTVTNPGPDPVGITLTQIGDTGFLGAITSHVDAQSQRSFVVASGGHDPDLAVILTADMPVVAEYTAYLPGADPVTGAVGIRDLSHIWYSAEGYQTKGWGDHLVVLNPDHGKSARVIITAYSPRANKAGQPPPFLTTTIPPRERTTIDLSTLDISGSFSTVLSSTIPIAVNRAETFGQTESSVTLSPSVERPSLGWAFPSGALGTPSTAGALPAFAGASEFLLLFNPSATQVGQVSLTLYGSTGTIIRPAPIALEPRQRLTIDLAKMGTPPGRNAALLESTNGVPFVAEQSVYYNKGVNGFSGPGVPTG